MLHAPHVAVTGILSLTLVAVGCGSQQADSVASGGSSASGATGGSSTGSGGSTSTGGTTSAGGTTNTGGSSSGAVGGGVSSGGGGSQGGASSGGATAQTGGSTSGGGGSSDGGASDGGSGGVADNAPVTVVVLGASTAAGKNLDVTLYGGTVGGEVNSWANRYAALLAAERPGSQLINLAKAGYSSYQALPTGTTNPGGYPVVDTARNITAALAENPDAIIVSFPGGAELGLGATVNDIVDNLRTIADTAAGAGAKTWLATPQPNLNQLPADVTFALALRTAEETEFGSFTLDFWSPLALPDDSADPSLILGDNIHPNAAGHSALFDVVVAAGIPVIALAP